MNSLARILQLVHKYGRQERLRRFFESTLALVALAAVGPLVLLGVDLLLAPAEWVRAGLVAVYLLAVAMAAATGLAHLILGPGRDELALQIEKRSGADFHNTLITAVQMPDPTQAQAAGLSGALVEAARGVALERLEKVELGRLTDFGKVRRLAGLAALVLLIAIPAVHFGRDRLDYRYLSLAMPRPTMPVTFEIEPGDVKVLAGSRLEILAKVDGLPADRAEVHLLKWDGAGEPERFELGHREDGRYALLFPTVPEGFRYRLQAGLFESPLFAVTTVSPPEIKALTLTYHRPVYTRLGKQIQKDPPYDITALIGTRVDLSLEASKPLSAGWVEALGARVDLTAIDKGPHQATLEVSQSGDYVIHLKDQDGFENPSPPRFQIYAIQDQLPQVVLIKPGSDLSMKASELTTIPLKIFAEDDYGLEKLSLKARFRQQNDFKTEEYEKNYPLDMPEVAGNQVTLDHVWDLREKIMQAGDSITYWIEARDQAPRAGEATVVGVSKTYRIDIPLALDLAEEVSEEQEKDIENLTDLVKRQKQVEERLGKVMKDVKRSRKMTYKEKKELEQLLSKQEEIKKKSEDLSQKMAKALETMRKHDLVDPGSLEKLQEIQKLFSEVATSKMKEMMNQMRDLMQQMQLDPEQLEQMSKKFDKQDYSKQLDRILENLKRLKQKQEIDRMGAELDDLMKKQEELREETARRTQEKEPLGDLAQNQEELEKRAESLFKQMEEQSKALESTFPEQSKQLAEMQSESRRKELSEEMKSAAEQMKQKNGPQSVQHQSKAMQQMSQMREQLSDVQQGMQQKQMSLDLEAIKTLLYLGLGISRVQENVVDTAENRVLVNETRKDHLQLAGLQYSASRGVVEFERQFEGAFKDDVNFKNLFLEQISQMVEEMDEAKDNFENSRLYSGRQLARQTLSRLNVVLLKLTELLEHLQNQQQQSGNDSFFDQMEQMMQKQRQLNQQTKRLQQSPQDSEMFKQMMMQQALEQQMIRETLEKLADKFDKAKELLGDLDKLGEDMKEVEDSLQKMDGSERTQEKQEEIYSNMLEFTKSHREQGQSRKRKAEAATEYQARTAVPSSTEEEAKQILFENISRGGYPPGFKDVVERYFSSFDSTKK